MELWYSLVEVQAYVYPDPLKDWERTEASGAGPDGSRGSIGDVWRGQTYPVVAVPAGKGSNSPPVFNHPADVDKVLLKVAVRASHCLPGDSGK